MADTTILTTTRLYVAYDLNDTPVTGLTDIQVNVYAPNNDHIVDNGTATEIGGGLYYYDVDDSLIDQVGGYPFTFYTPGGSVDVKRKRGVFTASDYPTDILSVPLPGDFNANSVAGYISRVGVTVVSTETDGNIGGDELRFTQGYGCLASMGNPVIITLDANPDPMPSYFGVHGAGMKIEGGTYDSDTHTWTCDADATITTKALVGLFQQGYFIGAFYGGAATRRYKDLKIHVKPAPKV